MMLKGNSIGKDEKHCLLLNYVLYSRHVQYIIVWQYTSVFSNISSVPCDFTKISFVLLASQCLPAEWQCLLGIFLMCILPWQPGYPSQCTEVGWPWKEAWISIRRSIFLVLDCFPHQPTQPPVQHIPKVLSSGHKAHYSLPPNTEVRNAWNYTSCLCDQVRIIQMKGIYYWLTQKNCIQSSNCLYSWLVHY